MPLSQLILQLLKRQTPMAQNSCWKQIQWTLCKLAEISFRRIKKSQMGRLKSTCWNSPQTKKQKSDLKKTCKRWKMERPLKLQSPNSPTYSAARPSSTKKIHNQTCCLAIVPQLFQLLARSRQHHSLARLQQEVGRRWWLLEAECSVVGSKSSRLKTTQRTKKNVRRSWRRWRRKRRKSRPRRSSKKAWRGFSPQT